MFSILIQGYTLEQLNKVHEGFNNNIIWNIAHVIVTQQILVYKLSGLPMIVTDEMVEKYRKGTKNSISLLKWKSTSITIDTNHGSNRARHRKDISQTLRNIHLHWVRAH
jgi:hypothetical protein